MLKKEIKFTDYNGNERTEEHYFNLEKSEIIEMEASTTGGLEQSIDKIIKAKDGAEIMRVFKDLIRRSYGEKDLDGVHFIKSEELSNRFMQSKAYDALFMELVTDDNAAAEFINGIIPNDIRVSDEEMNKIKNEINA